MNWGGDPNKPVEVLQDGSLRMSPRQSFARWQETVHGSALPWKPCEIEAVAELRGLIVGVVLRQADELASMNFELQRSNEELDSFAYIASHDLKEPLRGIHNYANFLMEDYAEALDGDGVEKLQTMVRLTQRMEDLINSLPYFSRLGRAELIRQPVNLNELVQQTIATLSMARPHSAIEFRLPQPLPVIECDRAQITDLYTNLISNAIKHNDKPQQWIEIGWIEPGDRDREGMRQNLSSHAATLPSFYVRDNGIGIAQDHLSKIFQIFRRLHGRDDFGGGTGVGLTIARKIVERHGGIIWVESIPSQGSTRVSSPRPGLIVLDLNLRGTDGREVLRRIKQDAGMKTIPVVVFTTSNNPKDIEDCYQYGVNSYIVKPINFAQLKRDIQTLVDYWFEVTTLLERPED